MADIFSVTIVLRMEGIVSPPMNAKGPVPLINEVAGSNFDAFIFKLKELGHNVKILVSSGRLNSIFDDVSVFAEEFPDYEFCKLITKRVDPPADITVDDAAKKHISGWVDVMKRELYDNLHLYRTSKLLVMATMDEVPYSVPVEPFCFKVAKDKLFSQDDISRAMDATKLGWRVFRMFEMENEKHRVRISMVTELMDNMIQMSNLIVGIGSLGVSLDIKTEKESEQDVINFEKSKPFIELLQKRQEELTAQMNTTFNNDLNAELKRIDKVITTTREMVDEDGKAISN